MSSPSFTFNLSTLFLVMTLTGVAAGLFATAPVLGILFLVVALPALIRTIMVISRRTVLGRATTPSEKLVEFLRSMKVVLLFLACIAIALVAGWWSACLGGAALHPAGEGREIAGFLAGALVGLALSGRILWRIWRFTRQYGPTR